MRHIKLIIVFITCLSLSSCALFRTKASQTPKVQIAPDVMINLPTPQKLDMVKSAHQILSASYRIDNQVKNYTSEVVVEVNRDHIILVAASGWGGTIFSIDYDGKTIESSSLPMPNAAMGIKHTLSDFIFTYADKKVLNQMLSFSGIEVIYKPKKRQFFLNNKLIMEINYQNNDPWQGKIELKNFLYHYAIKIETLS